MASVEAALYLIIVCLLAAVTPVCCSSSAADDVFLQFYLNQVKLWDQQGQLGKLQAAILPGLQAYCGKPVNFATCGINSTGDANFTTSSVVISPGYPVNANSRYLNVRFKISYNVGYNVVTLPVSVVTEIAQNQRETVSSGVGYYVIYINDIMCSVPPPAMANKVMVPIFVIGTIVLIIVAMALRQRQARQHRLELRKLGSEMKTSQRKASRSGVSGANKVGASTADLATAGDDSTKSRKEKSEVDGEKKKRKKKKTNGIDWSGGKNEKGIGGKDRGAEFNNSGFEKSMNEGDPRARQSGGQLEGGGGGGGGDSSGGDPRASQSALSEIIEVRGGDSSHVNPDKSGKKSKKAASKTQGKHSNSHTDGGIEKGIMKSLSSSHNKDSEELMLMDGSVFNPPEVNISEDHSGSEGDDVPTLRDSSDQQMI